MQPKLLLSILCFTLLQSAMAQTENVKPTDTIPQHKLNLLKTNITSIPFKNYSLQYERVLSKTVSLALTYRIMPASTIPFKSQLLKAIDDNDPDTKDIIDRTELSNYAITPEVRFYLGKGYGQGFYIAPFYRYVKFTSNQVPVSYDRVTSGRQTLNLSGELKANTGGVLFGAQWLLGKHLCLDWWILGAHYGSGKGDFAAVASSPLTPTEQQQIRETLEDIDIPLTKKTVMVTPSNVAVKVDGPFGGLRGGISFGFRF